MRCNPLFYPENVGEPCRLHIANSSVSVHVSAPHSTAQLPISAISTNGLVQHSIYARVVHVLKQPRQTDSGKLIHSLSPSLYRHLTFDAFVV